MKQHLITAYGWLVTLAGNLQSPFLLLIRLYWGWQFFLTGLGKLKHLERVTGFFQGLGIPLPHEQAILVGCVESGGGLLLLAGLASRLVSIPLASTLVVAYLTADFDRVKMLFSDPDKFVTADEFLFLFAVVTVFVFGPGKFSADYLLSKFYFSKQQK